MAKKNPAVVKRKRKPRKGLSNLIPLTNRTRAEHRAISAKGGRATKGILKPNLWRCKSCQYSKDKTCSLGLNLLKNAGKTIKRADGSRYKVPKSPKCLIPEAKRIILESATNPEGLIRMTKMFLTEAALKASSVKDNITVSMATLKLAAHIDPPIQRNMNLTANVDVNHALLIVTKVLMRRKHWHPAVKAIRDEFELIYKAGEIPE